jgi:hypothetical protein
MAIDVLLRNDDSFHRFQIEFYQSAFESCAETDKRANVTDVRRIDELIHVECLNFKL